MVNLFEIMIIIIERTVLISVILTAYKVSKGANKNARAARRSKLSHDRQEPRGKSDAKLETAAETPSSFRLAWPEARPSPTRRDGIYMRA